MNRLLAGAAKVDITPEKMGLRLGGHAVNRVAVGVRDPLYARAVALSDGGAPLVLVGLDLVGLMRGYVEKIRARLPQYAPHRLWVCCTHTHDAPDTIGFWGPMIREIPLRTGLDAEYMDFLIERVATAIEEAVNDLSPAAATAAHVLTPSIGLTRNVRQEGMKDDEIQILQLTSLAGPVIATVYNYACHPEFFGHHHRRISAGWPGVANERLERMFGGTALLLQNALGGMVTGATSRDDGAFEPRVGAPFVGQLGRRIAEYVECGLRENARPIKVETIATEHAAFLLPIENKVFRLAARLNIFPRWMLGQDKKSVITEVNIARLGPVVMATLPGEALPEVGFVVKQMLGAPYPWVLNLACDELGYLLPESHWRQRNYRYEQAMSPGSQTVPLIFEKLKELLRAD